MFVYTLPHPNQTIHMDLSTKRVQISRIGIKVDIDKYMVFIYEALFMDLPFIGILHLVVSVTILNFTD